MAITRIILILFFILSFCLPKPKGFAFSVVKRVRTKLCSKKAANLRIVSVGIFYERIADNTACNRIQLHAEALPENSGPLIEVAYFQTIEF